MSARPIVSTVHRGVLYGVIARDDGTVELRAGTVLAGTGKIEVRIDSRALLGGTVPSGEAIFAALERALFERLMGPPAERVSTPQGGVRGPWYITIAAVEQYCAIRGWDGEGDAAFGRAEDELVEMASAIVAAGKEGTATANGLRTYRGPRPLRLRLVVSHAVRSDGELPQLVAVKPDHEGRGGAYQRSRAPKRTR